MSHLFEDGIVNRQILSIQQTVGTSNFSTSSTSFIGVSFSEVTVTPKSANSTFLIIAEGTFSSVTGWATIRRVIPFVSTTNLGSSSFGLLAGTGSSQFRAGSMIAYDEPGTTSTIIYDVAIRSLDANSVGWGFGYHTLTVIEFDKNSGI